MHTEASDGCLRTKMIKLSKIMHCDLSIFRLLVFAFFPKAYASEPATQALICSSFTEKSREIYSTHIERKKKTSHTLADGSPVIFPDGRHILFSRSKKSQNGSKQEEIWIMNIDGSNERRLTNNKLSDWDSR